MSRLVACWPACTVCRVQGCPRERVPGVRGPVAGARGLWPPAAVPGVRTPGRGVDRVLLPARGGDLHGLHDGPVAPRDTHRGDGPRGIPVPLVELHGDAEALRG